MKLGTTFSPVSESNTDVLNLVDYLEVPAWLEFDCCENTSPVELLLHNLDLDWSLASTDAIDPGWQTRLQAELQRTRSPWFSIHLGFASEVVKFDDHMHPASEPLSREVLFERFASNLRDAISLCPVPLLVENLDYCPEGAYEHVCEPAFISEILDTVDCGFLLDIGHLQVSASWLEMTPEQYLEQLPMDRVVEVHISGPRPHAHDTGLLDDVHEELIDRDLHLLRSILCQSDPQALTLEYRRDAGKLVKQLGALRSILE